MTTQTNTENPHITEVRSIMMAQLRALKGATKDDLDAELSKSKAINALSQTLINSARVEIDYLKETGQQQSKFLELPPEVNTGNLPNGITGIHRNNADTIKPKAKNWVGIAQ